MADTRGGGKSRRVDNPTSKLPTPKETKFTLKIKAESDKASMALKELERQAKSLQSIFEQGSKQQDGFLSTKQVSLYKRMLKEMEDAYDKHAKNLARAKKQASAQDEKSPAYQKMQSLQQEIQKRQSNDDYAQKNVMSEKIKAYHQLKLTHAYNNLHDWMGTPEYSQWMSNKEYVNGKLGKYESAVNRLKPQIQIGQDTAKDMGNLHELTAFKQDLLRGMEHVVSTIGGGVGLGWYAGYTKSGMGLLREQDRAGLALSQRAYNPDGNDRDYRNRATELGRMTNSGGIETLQLQKLIAEGGVTNTKALASDTVAYQRFGKSYAVDPSLLASGGAMLERMGTFREGDQQRFANMIGGAVAKSGMSGRQEEMIRATVSLANQVSRGQATMGADQLANVMGLQVGLGKAIPSLKGEKGADLLTTMDAHIKQGGQGLDILMGKGWKQEYTGIQGAWNLKLQQSRGIGDSKNLQLIMQGMERQFGKGAQSKTMTKLALTEQLGVPVQLAEELENAGFLDKISKGELSGKDLEKYGDLVNDKKWKQYLQSETSDADNINAGKEQLKSSNAKAADWASKGIQGAFFNAPMPLQLAGMGAMVVGSGAGMRFGSHLAKGLLKQLPTIEGKVPGSSFISKWFPKATPTVEAMAEKGVINTVTEGASSLVPAGIAGTRGMAGGMKLLSSTAGKAVPIVGGLMEVGTDRLSHPEHSWGRSLAKGAGNIIGGALGVLATGALGLGTGGAGFLTGAALTTGGSMLGSKVGDSIYSMFAGDDDKKSAKNHTAVSKASEGSASLGSLNVSTLNINSKAFDSYFSPKEAGKGMTHNEQKIRITIDGDIKGMNENNQKAIKDAIKDYFGLQYGKGATKAPFLNLSYDQSRK